MKKVIIYTLIVVISSWLFVNNGYCVGEIQNVFIPSETYPEQLKDLHLQTEIVENGVAKVIIVVDTSNSTYNNLANNILATVSSLTGVTLQIIDDNAFVAAPDFTKNIILIGNYSNNEAIEEYVYKPKKQLLDIDRPGNNHWVISNVRIGEGADFTNAIVIASQSDAKLEEAVNVFIGLLSDPLIYQGNSIIFDESDPNKRSTRWSWTAGYTPPNPNFSVLTPPLSAGLLETAAGKANQYLLTGNTTYVNDFVNLLYNYGLCAENPLYFDNVGNEFNWAVGDNSGNLDFSIHKVVAMWRVLERSPYFSYSNLPNHPNYPGMSLKLYITKLINWMMREFYKCDNVSTAMYYAGLNNYPLPLGNHEVNAALSAFVAGQYFGQDGYDYNQTIATIYDPNSFNPTHPDYSPNNYADGWIEDADGAFDVYLNLSFPNDNAAGYYQDNPQLTREYCWFKNDETISEQYFDNTGGALGNGADRSVADLFSMLSPPSNKTAGFSDTHGYVGPDYDMYALRFWREYYQDGRYTYILNKYGNPTLSDVDDWRKIWHQFGLGQTPSAIEPVDLLGVKILPLEEQLRLVLNAFDNGIATYGNAGVPGGVYGNPLSEVHTDPGDIILNKLTLRSGFNIGDQFMAIDCIGTDGHGHHEQLGINTLEDNNRILIVDHSFNNSESGWSGTRDYNNALKVEKKLADNSYEEAARHSSTAAGLKDLANFDKTGFVQMKLSQYGQFEQWGTLTPTNEWSVDLFRSIFWKRDGLFVVLDEVKTSDTYSAGNYRITLNWKSLGDLAQPFTEESTSDTHTYTINQSGEHCAIKTLHGNYPAQYQTVPCPAGQKSEWATYPHADENTLSMLRATVTDYALSPTQKIILPTLIYAYSGITDPYQYNISQINNDTIYHITSLDPNEHIYLGKAENTQTKTFANFNVEANMFYIDTNTSLPDYFALVNGYSLSQNPNIQLFASDIPISIEFDLVELNGIIDIAHEQGLATIGLYNPQNYPLYVDNLPAQNSGWLNGVTTFNLETEEGEGSQHQFYFDDGSGPDITISINDLSVIEGNSGTVNAAFNVTLSQVSSESVSVNYATANGTATAGSDYVFTSGTLTIPANTLSGTINVSIIGDTDVEPDETFLANLANPVNATITDGQGQGIILNDDSSTPQGNNVALGKSYQCTPPNPSYLDSGGELTDGLYAPPSSRRVGWSGGWGGVLWNFWVKIDLAEIIPINSVLISAFGGDQPGWGGMVFPDSMDVYTALEDNPNAYTLVTTIINPIGNPGVMQTYVFEGNFNANARYVKVIFNCSPSQGGGSGFVLLDEIEILAPETPPNQPPEIDSIPPTTVPAKQTAVVNVSATDPDNDPITLSVTPLPAKATFVDNGNGTGTFTLDTTRPMAGNTYEFTLTADDGQGGVDTELIIINVIGPYVPTGANRQEK